MFGLDLLLAESNPPFAGKRIAYLAHGASRDLQGTHGVTRILQRNAWELLRLFSPEHGFAGTGAAGEHIPSGIHPDSGLPVKSLYGEHRRPPSDWLQDLDALIIDLQDLGVRCYTYASTLDYCLEACAAAGLPVLVLDRPTPLAGCCDGPALQPELRSFVGEIDLPLVFGLSQPPLAAFLKQTRPYGPDLHLSLRLSDSNTGSRPWFPPSPAIQTPSAARFYPMTVLCEALGDVDVDRSGPRAFQCWSMPDLPGSALLKAFSSSPIHCQIDTGANGWPRISFQELPASTPWQPVRMGMHLLAALRDALGADRLFSHSKARPDFFDQLLGSRLPREQLILGAAAEEIYAEWPKSIPTTVV